MPDDFPPGTVLFHPEGQLDIVYGGPASSSGIASFQPGGQINIVYQPPNPTPLTLRLSLEIVDPTLEQVTLIKQLRDLFDTILATKGPRLTR